MNLIKFLMFIKFSVTLALDQSIQQDIKEHVNIIMDLYHFYHSTSLTVLHFTKNDNALQKNLIFNLARTLSNEKVKTSIISFEELTPAKYYNRLRDLKGSVLPLNFIFITSINSIFKMKNLAKNFPLHGSINYLFFMKSDEDGFNDFCMSPVGNPFELRFDTLLFVKCYDDNRIREWNLQTFNQTFVYDWAIWKPESGLVLKSKKTMHIRRGLQNKTLRIATVKNSYVIAWENGKLTGFFGDLLHELQEALNFTVEHVKYSDTYGRWDEISETWTGALGLAVRGEVDLVVSDFSFTAHRMCCVDFTVPLISLQQCLFIKQFPNRKEVSWWGYFRPFQVNIWGTIILFLLITPILLTLMRKQVEKFLANSNFILDDFFDVWAIFCQQGLSNTLSVSSIRIAYFSISALAFINLSVYSASLISSLTIQTTDVPFRTVEDFVKDGTYRLAVVRDSSKYEQLHSANDSTFKRMSQLLVQKNILPISLQDGMDLACNQRVVFYDRETAIRVNTVKIKCPISQINIKQIDTVGMIMRKNSPYKYFINYYLRKMENNGVMQRIRSRYFNKEIFWTNPTVYKKVEFSEIIFLLVIVGGGVILGTIILIAEKLFFSYKNRIENKRSKMYTKNNKFDAADFEKRIKKSAQYSDKRELILNFLQVNYIHRVVQTPIIKLLKNNKD